MGSDFEKYQDNQQVGRLLQQSGVHLLFNEKYTFEIKEIPLTIVGVGDYLSQSCRPVEAFTNLNPMIKHPTILLCHNPDAKQFLAPYHWDLMLCGHTHGGQLNLFGVRPFLSMVIENTSLVAGLYSCPYASGHRHIFITHGVGNLMGARFNCRPEISILNVV